jgi:hypothetical protein
MQQCHYAHAIQAGHPALQLINSAVFCFSAAAMLFAQYRAGRVQTLAAMLNDVRQQHQQQRVLPAMAAHQARVQQLRAAHAAACAAVTRANEMAVRQAMRSQSAAVQQVKENNERKVRKGAM